MNLVQIMETDLVGWHKKLWFHILIANQQNYVSVRNLHDLHTYIYDYKITIGQWTLDSQIYLN